MILSVELFDGKKNGDIHCYEASNFGGVANNTCSYHLLPSQLATKYHFFTPMPSWQHQKIPPGPKYERQSFRVLPFDLSISWLNSKSKVLIDLFSVEVYAVQHGSLTVMADSSDPQLGLS